MPIFTFDIPVDSADIPTSNPNQDKQTTLEQALMRQHDAHLERQFAAFQRPPADTKMITVRIPSKLVAELDRFAEAWGANRGMLIRYLIADFLKSPQDRHLFSSPPPTD